jgi:hypothetical protein
MGSDPYPEVTASMSDGSVTLKMTTRYGPICFSYSPQAIEAGVSQLVAEALHESKDASSTFRDVLRRSGLPADKIIEGLESYRRSQETKFPDDAIEKFTRGTRAHVQGTVEQFSEGLAPGIALLMDHLAVTSLTCRSTNLDYDWPRKGQQSYFELRAILAFHFRRAIHSLWDRLVEN